MSMIDISVKRPIGTIMAFIGVILLGWISFSNLSIDLLPDLSYPKITVLTEYPGSGPEEIERLITTGLEGSLSSIPGVKEINSVSKEGASVITLEFHWGTDMDFALLHTKEKSEEARKNLPDDCEAPVIMEWDPSASPIIIATISSSERDAKSLKEAAEFIVKPRLEQLDGIARVEVRGGDEEEISVEIDPVKSSALNVTLAEIKNAITNNNIISSGGTVSKDNRRYNLKIDGEVQTPAEIESILIKKYGNRSITIKDIGKAFYKNKIKQGDIRFNANQSLSLLLYKESGGNTVNATKSAEKTFKSLSNEFNDLRFRVISKEADLIISSIDSLISSLVMGGALAFLVLLMFLQNPRDPSLGAVSIIISIVSTFTLMFFLDVNVNIMSLGGLVLGVGMFVDNSIIVIESIYRHRDEKNIIQSIIRGTKEVGGAISASTLTTISIFLPVIYLYGITGKLFKDQALTVSFSLISSLVVAITLLPALSAFRTGLGKNYTDDLEDNKKDGALFKLLRGSNHVLLLPFKILGNIILYTVGTIYHSVKLIFFRILPKLLSYILTPCYKVFNSTYKAFDKWYHKMLERFLNNKKMAGLLALIVVTSIYLSFMVLKVELLPTPESEKFEIKALTAPVYGYEETEKIGKQIENQLYALDGVDFVYTELGAVSKLSANSEDFSVNNLHFIIRCESPEARAKAMKQAEELMANADLLNYSIFLEKNTLSQYLAMEGDNFQVKVYYEDIENGKDAVAQITKAIEPLKISELKATTSEGKPLYVLKFRQDVLDKLNLTKDRVANYIEQAVKGEKAGTLKKIQKSYDIFVRVPVLGVMEAKTMMGLQIPVNGATLYLKDLVEVDERASIKQIERESQERFFLISGKVEPEKLDTLISKAEPVLYDLDMPYNTRYKFDGESEERKKAFDSLNSAILLAIVLVYMIMAAKFENLIQPLIIMLTVPMGLIGAFLFLLVSGNSLNIISGIGILVLVGIGVNDAIVKVEYSNQMMENGSTPREAIMKASSVRLRPILMTTFTTVLGLVPMALIHTTGSELQRPLALVIIGGLLFTTFLTLIFIPVSYELVADFKLSRQKKKQVAES